MMIRVDLGFELKVGHFKDQFGMVLGSLRKHFGVIVEVAGRPLLGHLGGILEPSRRHLGSILEAS